MKYLKLFEEYQEEHIGKWYHGGTPIRSSTGWINVTDELKEATYYANLRNGNIYQLKDNYNYLVKWALGHSEGRIIQEDIDKYGGFYELFELYTSNI